MCSRRRLPGCSGKDTCGKFTAVSEDPLSLYLISLPATSTPILACASSVLPPTCGVRMTLSNSRRGDTNGSPAPFGSFGKNVERRAADLPGAQRLRQRIDVHTWPRDALISLAPGFIRESCSAPIMRSVPVFRHVQSDYVEIGQQFVQGINQRARCPARALAQYRSRTPACPPIRPAARSASRCGRSPRWPSFLPRYLARTLRRFSSHSPR